MKKTQSIVIILLLSVILACATFAACCNGQREYKVAYVAADGGTLQGNATQNVKKGSDGEYVTAVPNDGYWFDCWSDGNTSASRKETNVQSDVTLTAYFVPQSFTMRYNAGAGGKISGKTVQNIANGQSGEQVTAVPDKGYIFDKWSDGIATASRTDSNLTASTSVTACFAPVMCNLSYAADINGQIKGEQNQTVRQYTNGNQVTAVPNVGYRFVRWSDGITTASRQDTEVHDNVNVTAYFAPAEYAVVYEAVGNGTVIGKTTQALLSGQTGESVTAVPDDGYKFVNWSDGIKTATRQDTVTLAGKKVTAYFRKLETFTVEYFSYGVFGHVEGKLIQEVTEGGSTTEVTAVIDAADGVFKGWSDGVTSLTRKDENVSCNMRIEALFSSGGYIEYVVDGVGGHIEGQTKQLLLNNAVTERVTAVADDGYVFAGWSDNSDEAERFGDKFTYGTFTINYNPVYQIAAYFEPNIKTFVYDYNGSDSHPPVSGVSVARQSPKDARFVIPAKRGYKFDGWYADNDFKLKVVNADGRLMLGYYTVSVQSDTLYAKWLPEDEQRIIYPKILIIAGEEFDLDVRDNNGEVKRMQAKLVARDRAYYVRSARLMLDLLNMWFEDKVAFEIDLYFTMEVIKDDDPNSFPGQFSFFPPQVAEPRDLYSLYGSVIGIAKLQESYNGEFVLYAEAGSAGIKYAEVYFRENNNRWSLYASDFLEFWTPKSVLTQIGYDLTYNLLHEFTHTVEMKCVACDVNDKRYHDTIYLNLNTDWESTQKYLTNTWIINGETVGIPPSYWTEGGDYEIK